jgi:hypothetical protein
VARTRSTKLGKSYDGLGGPALLTALAEHGETGVLEAFWRYRNAQVAAEAAPAIFASGDTYLLSLVVDEILSPELAPPLPQAVANAVSGHEPELAKADADRLAERLQDGNPLHAWYEPSRPALLAWVVLQPGKVGEEAALEVIARRSTGSEHGNVRQAAYARCRESKSLLTAAAEAVAEELERAPNYQTWQQAAEFVEQASRDESTTPAAVVPIVQKLIETAPNYPQNQPFGETLRRLAVGSALDAVEAHVSRSLADSPGARAILALLPEVTSATRRATLWAVAARAQQQLSKVVLQRQMTTWDEAEWRRVIRALARPEPIYRPTLNYIVEAAPIELTADLTHLVMAQVAKDDALISIVGQRLRERLKALGEDPETRDAWVAAVHWPKARDAESIEKFDAIAGCVEGNLHVRLLVRGYLANKIRADIAARLVPSGQVGRALKIVAAGGRGEWASALASEHPDEIGAAAGEATGPEAFDLDVVAALAPERPDVAFARADAAWPHLSADQKEAMVELLEEHGVSDSIEALCAVIRDDHRDNAKRRGRAARRLGVLLEPGSTLPEPVLELLNSNLHDLRAAAVEAIERVKPREPELIARLHDVEDARGAAGKAAAAALNALAEDFLAEFAQATDKEDLREIIPLLGAVGRISVLQPLFEYVGSNAVYDDAALHQRAAAAIREASEHIADVSAEDQEGLVALLDGEEQETDIKARDDLSAALARLQLGDDVALQVLYDQIKITPKAEPERLFGAEKEPLVRQLALYDRARKRGQDGWGAELAHLDNIAERLVRAAYLVADGTSAAIVEQIRNDSRAPDYGSIITALASAKQLHGIQAPCKMLHDARCNFSEIPHAGEQADIGTMTTSRQCFVKLAKVCVGTLKREHSTF